MGRVTGTTPARVTRHLFVVSREKRWLFDYLQERFADDPKVTIVLDRRLAERRQRHDRPAIDRRRAERRAGGHAGEDELVPQGYFIVDL